MFRRFVALSLLLAVAAPAHAASCPLIFSEIVPANLAIQPGQMVQLANGHLLIADTYNDRVVELTENGTSFAVHGPDIPGHGKFFQPTGVSVDLVGHVYVADTQNNRILKFDSSMALMTEWSAEEPGHLTLSTDGSVIYSTELNHNHVSRYRTTDGLFLGSWGTFGNGPGQFSNPFGIALDAAGNVYVSEELNDRIQVFSSTGVYLRQIGERGFAPGQFSVPTGIEFDDFGNLYVCDSGNQRIQMFNSSFIPVCEFGVEGLDPGQVSRPRWAYPARDGSVYLMDMTSRVQRFVSSAPPPPPPPVTGGSLNLSWTDCGASGTENRTFACASNTGSNVMVASYDPALGVADFVGNEMRINLISTGSLPAWWQMFNGGTCRGTAVPTLNTTFGASCADNFAGAGFGAIGSYTIGANTASLLCGWAVAEGVPIDVGTEYYALNIAVNNTKTVGTGACAGCSQSVCLVLQSITLAYGPSATLTQLIQAPLNRNWITWQGSAGIPGGCPGATPSNRKTWGQLKALYR